jgi:anti-anti-sigma factor
MSYLNLSPKGPAISGAGRPLHFGVQDVVWGRCHTLFLRGELDLAASDYMEAVVFCMLLDTIEGITLDLSNLSFVDAAGLRALLAVRELCRHRGYAFSLTRPMGQVRRLFELTGAASDLPIASPVQASRPPREQHRRLRALSTPQR